MEALKSLASETLSSRSASSLEHSLHAIFQQIRPPELIEGGITLATASAHKHAVQILTANVDTQGQYARRASVARQVVAFEGPLLHM